MYYNSNLKYLLKINNIKNVKLAEKLNISRQSVNDLLKATDPKASTLIKLANIFKVSIDDLLLKDLTK